MNSNRNEQQADQSAKEKLTSCSSESPQPAVGKEKKSKRNFFSRAKMFNSRREKKASGSACGSETSDGATKKTTTKKTPKWTNPFNCASRKNHHAKPSTSTANNEKEEEEERVGRKQSPLAGTAAISLEYVSTNPCCMNQMKEVVQVEIVTMDNIDEQQLNGATAANVTAVMKTVKSPIKQATASATLMLPVVKEEEDDDDNDDDDDGACVVEAAAESGGNEKESLPCPSTPADSEEEYMEMSFQPENANKLQSPQVPLLEKEEEEAAEARGGDVDHLQQQQPEQPIEQEPQPNPEIPHVHIEKAEGIRGIYATAMNTNGTPTSIVISAPFVDTHLMRMVHEDCDEAARIARAREIEQGVDPPANYRPIRRLQVLCSEAETENGQTSQTPPRRLQIVCPPDLNVETLKGLFQNHVTLRSCPLDTITGCHTQVDFIHCLVPDLMDITNCSFYWGKMDRYEAERLLEGKPEGTFLLRDSAQDEFLFSVSFRKYGRSLHARLEQWNHRFSFDSHDPGVYTSDSVCGLIEHYKDPSSCMFFEPMLTWPLHRNFTFPLQHLARASIVSRLTYDNINHLQLPKTLKAYLKEYHYRQKVRVENFDDDVQWLELRNVPP